MTENIETTDFETTEVVDAKFETDSDSTLGTVIVTAAGTLLASVLVRKAVRRFRRSNQEVLPAPVIEANSTEK
jgi:hypothetical protein